MMRKILIFVTASVALYYIVFRALYTFNPDQMGFSLLFFMAEVHGLILLYLFLFDMWSPVHPEPSDPPDGLGVDVYIPTYNEDVSVLRRTALGAKNMRYPHKTYILDDGDRKEVRAMADELGIHYIARPEHNHAKAGNINHALRHTEGDFIVIFDADHIPQPNFLERTLGFFRDERMAFVQTPQFFYNLGCFESRADEDKDGHWEQQSMFFHYLQPGKQRWNSAFFCGTCAVIRREALEEVGGIATETITEDIHTSVLLHARGWKSTYLDEHLATGMAPPDVVSYFKQRQRWALGNLRVMFICNPLTKKGLTLPQRLSYFSAMFCWTIGFQKIIYYLTPPLMLMTPLMPIDRFFTSLIGLYFGNLLLQLLAYKLLTGGQGRIFMDERFNMLNFWFLIQAYFRAMFGLGQHFEVTSKSGADDDIPLIVVTPQWILAGINAAALGWWGLQLFYGMNVDLMSSSIAAFWTAYVLMLALMAMQESLSRVDVRSDYRFREYLPVWFRTGNNDEWHLACAVDFNTQGLGLATFEPLDVGQDIPVRIMCDTGPVDTQIRPLRQTGHDRKNGSYYYGTMFPALDSRGRDQLNDQIIQHALPSLMSSIHQLRTGWKEVVKGFLPFKRKSYPGWMGLPLTTLDAPGEWRTSRLEGLSGRDATLSSKEEGLPGDQHDFSLCSHVGVIKGRLRILSVDKAPKTGTFTWRVFLETMAPEHSQRLEHLASKG